MLLTVGLNNLLTTCMIGIYSHEKEVPNSLRINLKVSIDNNVQLDNIQTTLNYESLYKLVMQNCLKSYNLLETLALDIIENIKTEFENIHSLHITIEKLKPIDLPALESCYIEYQIKF